MKTRLFRLLISLKPLAQLVSPAITLIVSGGVAYAQTTLPGLTNVTTVDSLRSVVFCSIAYWMFWLLIPLAVIFVMVAAYRYLTSAGDPEKVKDATKTLTFAAAAIVVALLARAFPLIIFSIFPGGVSGTNQSACP